MEAGNGEGCIGHMVGRLNIFCTKKEKEDFIYLLRARLVIRHELAWQLICAIRSV